MIGARLDECHCGRVNVRRANVINSAPDCQEKIREILYTSPAEITLYNEYKDLWRFHQDGHLGTPRDFYQKKYAGHHFT